MSVGIGELFFLVVIGLFLIVPFGLLVWALVDLAPRPTWEWQASQQNQIVWVLVVLLVGCVGPILYLVVARPRLEAAAGRGDEPDGRPRAERL